MPNKVISHYLNQSCPDELKDDDWIKLSHIFVNLTEPQQSTLLSALGAHSGIFILDINTSLKLMAADPGQQAQIILSLQHLQQNASSKIDSFQQRIGVKRINTEALSLSRSEWLSIIARFELQKGKNLTPLFFLHSLSIIRKVSYESLVAITSRTQPTRAAKILHPLNEGENTLKRWRPNLIDDGGVNPLILESTNQNLALQAKILATGARSANLVPATPERGYTQTSRTPGQTKVRPVFTIGTDCFFKPLTPYGNKADKGRVDVRQASLQKITTTLPRLQPDRAGPIEFIATFESMNERSGKTRRISQKSIKKVTCADVFRAHGIEIQSTDGRAHHWSHTIAHFLGGGDDLVPATAAANYNTLEAIELFIQKKLISKTTDQIHIHVEPIYSGESLIPDLLIYSLNWIELNECLNQKKSEVFYINPQSYLRFTHSMHESLKLARSEQENSPPPSINL